MVAVPEKLDHIPAGSPPVPEKLDHIPAGSPRTRQRSETVRGQADGAIEASADVMQRSLALRQRIGRLEWPDVRVLNVEDYAPSRLLRTRTLENAGYVVNEAGSVAEALSRPAAEPPVHLALVDVGLPDGDGFELCEQLKAQHPGLPVVIITSLYRTASARQQGIGVGADEYVLDPLPAYRLVRTLDRVLSASPQIREASVVTTDHFGMIVGVNASACQLLNISARGAIGRSLLAFVGADRPRLARGLELATAGQFVQEEMILRPRERKPLRVEVDLDGGGPSTRTVEWAIQPVSSPAEG